MRQGIKSILPEFKANKLLDTDLKILTFLGFNPEGMINIRSFLIFSLSLVLEIFPEFNFIVKHSDDVQAVFMCLHEFVSLLVFVVKVIVFFLNRNKIVSLISELREEWSRSFDDPNPRWKREGKKLENQICKTARFMFVFIFFSASFYFVPPIVIYFLFFADGENPQWPLPVQVYYGFEFTEHPWRYVSFILVTIPHMLMLTQVFYGIEILFVNILIYCTSYMKYIQSELAQLKDDLESSLVDDETIKRRVRKIIVIHQTGIRLAEKLEEVLNFLMLVLYSVNTMVLCFLFFEFHILLNDLINLFKVLIFFGVVQSLLVLYSYFGTKLMEESEAVGFAVYDLPWYNFNDCGTRKHLLLTIVRSQRSVNISSSKFYPVNLESYCNALSTAYSYCSILLKVM